MAKLILDNSNESVVKKPTLVLDTSSVDDRLREDTSGPTLVEDKPSIFETAKQKLAALDKKMAGEYDQNEADAWGKMGKLNKVLDVLGRPGYAFKASIQQEWDANNKIANEIRAKYGDTGTGIIQSPETHKKMMSEIKTAIFKRRGDIRDNLSAIYRGLTGKERETGNEQLGQLGVSGIPLAGFAYELVTDPMMYGGYSALSKATVKTAKGVGELGGKIPGVTPVVEGVKGFIEPIKEMVSTKSKIPALDNLIDRWLSERHFLKGQEIQFGAKTRLAVASIARQSKTTPKEVGGRIANIIELSAHPDELSKVVPNILPQERVLANTLKSHFDSMIIDEMKRGVPIEPLSYVRDSKIAKLRKNLETVRVGYGKELATSRGKLVRELDLYGDKQVSDYVRGLKREMTQIEKDAHTTHIQNVKQLDSQISGIEKKMSELELLKIKASKENATRTVTTLDKQLGKLENQFWYLHSELADRLQDIPELAKNSPFIKKINDISKLLSADIEVNLGQKGTSLAKQIMESEKKIGKLPQSELGMPTGESRKLLKALTIERAKKEFGYFPRITTDEAKKILMTMRIGRSKLWTPQMANALRRQTHDFTLDEFNQFVQSFGLKSLEGNTISQFFMTDPSYATAVRGTRSAKAITSAEFLKDVGKTFGTLEKDAPVTYMHLPDTTLKLNPSLQGLLFPPEVASEIGRMTEFYFNPQYRPDVWGRFLKHYDSVLNTWKRWQLAVFPKYHLRNAVGNMWNNFLADVNPSTYPKAAALQAYRKFRSTPLKAEISRRALKTLGISVDDAEKIIGSAERLGVLESGCYSADIDFSVTQALGKGGVSGRGMAVGRTIENNARLAHFIDRLTKGKSVEEAALSTKKYLFDYGDLTHFEKTVLKRMFPFYSWTRKNIPLQLESLMNKPEKFAPLAVPLRQRQPHDLLRLKYSDPNLYQRLPVELQRTIDSVTYVPLEGILPAGDLAKLVRPQELVYELMTPFLKEPAEQMFNKDLYSGKDIQSYEGQNHPLWGVDVPVRLRHIALIVLPSARITREIDKMVTKSKQKLPLTSVERAFASSLSTVYKSSLKDLRTRAITKVNRDLQDLMKGAYRAKREGRLEEFKAIKKTMRDVIREMRGIK